MEFALAAGIVELALKAIPTIRDMINSGDLSDEEVAEWRRRYTALRVLGGDAYSGPDYELSGR